jgi:predicted kinase
MVSFDHLLDFGLPRHLWTVDEITEDDLWHILFNFAELQLSLGVSVIMDAVFMGEGRDTARNLAKKYRARFRAIHTFCSDENVWRSRIVERMKSALPNETPATWEGIVSERNRYKLWQPSDALFVDAVQRVDENLDKVWQYLNQP